MHWTTAVAISLFFYGVSASLFAYLFGLLDNQ